MQSLLALGVSAVSAQGVAVEGGGMVPECSRARRVGFQTKRIQRKGSQKIKIFQNFLDHDKVNYLLGHNQLFLGPGN